MGAIKLRDGFCQTGIIGDELRVFGIVMYTELGTTYDSYAMKTGDKVVLFETVKARSLDDCLEKLKEIIDAMKIDYLVTSHTEPDYVGSVERLLDYSPQMKVLATPCTISFSKEIMNRGFVSIAVKSDQRMTIDKRTLYFMLVPNLHRPNIMYTFIEEGQTLMTCDPFGSHYCLKEAVPDKTQDEDGYLGALRYYFNCIVGSYKPSMLKALDRVESLDISMVCTDHGPVLVEDRIKQVMALYRGWPTVVSPNRKKTVIIPYVGTHGCTGMLVEKIAQGAADSSGTDVYSYDMVMVDTAKVQEELQLVDRMLFSTPTIIVEVLRLIWDLTLGMFSIAHGGEYAGAFSSYSWSGEGIPRITERLKQLRMKVVDGLKVRPKPSDADLVGTYEFGYQFGCLVQPKKPGVAVAKGGRKLVKCLACEEIFDSSIEICPVRGVDQESSVPVEDATNDFTNNTTNDYLILGNDVTGFNATKAIRERDATGRITMVSEGPYPSYNHPMLTKPPVVDPEPEQIVMVDALWYEENQVCQMLGKRVEGVDTDAKRVLPDDGTRLRFTKLIYALGSEYSIPSVGGSRLPEVAAIRWLSDIRRVEALMRSMEKTVVIGGGVLRLEAIWELKKAGLEVTMFEIAPFLMGHRMDESSGEQLKIVASRAEVVIHIGVSAEATGGDGYAGGVRLKTGEVVTAEMTIMSTGIRVNIELVKKMGSGVKKGVVVSERVEISVSGIYVCGDCAQYHDGNYDIQPEVVKQGKTAGTSAVGDSLEYTPAPAALAFHGMNTVLFAVGNNGRNLNLYCKTVGFRDMGKEQHRKYYFLNN